jgi:hypothetical protein
MSADTGAPVSQVPDTPYSANRHTPRIRFPAD